MFGPPGTGKTEFVKYLGKKLDRKVVVMKGSDILGMYVGESEQNIANAFRRAEREKAILFFDEIDGLLQSRENAHASWEVTQVNELLQQMENFNGVMVAATNFCQNLDPAVMRRFTFKLEFDYLDDAGKKIFFEKMFKAELSEEESSKLKELTNLAPGDFRTVRQEMFYLGDEITNLDRIAALKEECAHKKDGKKTATIGF
jgi:SpoVK/Ycf46/Vps4 family AAA+-type ATPase